jgi:hypothetical protein
MLALLLWNSRQKFTVSAREALDPGWLQGRRSVLALAGRPPASHAAAPGNSWSSRIDSEVPCHFHPANPAIAELIKNAESRFGEPGRLVIRYSGTEPLLRIMAEGPDGAKVKSVVSELKASLGDLITELSNENG